MKYFKLSNFFYLSFIIDCILLMQYPNVPHPINKNSMHNNYSTGFVGRISPYPT